MSKLIELIKALAPGLKSQKELDEAYMAGAVDIFDLERRLREIDNQAGYASRASAFGFSAS